jgi:hypothetical protein
MLIVADDSGFFAESKLRAVTRYEQIRNQEVNMKVKKLMLLVIIVVVIAMAPLWSQASGDSVGLGISFGAVFPNGSTPNITSTDWKTSLNWGFYVNIPLIYTFHLTPSSELYKFDGQNATDMSIAFKFIVPLSRFDLYAGFVPGLTAVTDVTAPHVGVLVGGNFPLISNLDFFIQGKYKWLFEGGENLRVLHANVGVLFNF